MSDDLLARAALNNLASLKFDLKSASEAMCRYAKDASRYAWLKANARRIDFAGLCVSDMGQLDARIDAALRGEGEK